MPLGPAQQYLAEYNGQQLPGYVQNESFDSQLNIAQHYGAYIDGSPSEDTGLANKVLNLTLKVWEQDYLTCKQQVDYAATILRSKRNGWAPLHVQYSDKHYDAMVKNISISKEAGTSVRTLDYSIEFECRPWLIGESLHTFSGSSPLVTTGRTISNGGWSPTIITVTGSNIDIVGVDSLGETTGHITINGSVTNLVIDTEAFTAVDDGGNKNAQMTTADYRMYVGTGETTYTFTGASSIEVKYYDRWHI